MADVKQYVSQRVHLDNVGGKVVDFYDFDVSGGATGTITLEAKLPANAIVSKGYIHVLSACTSTGSATISAGLNTTTDLLGATAVADFSANAIIPLLPSFTAALDGNAAAGGVANSAPLRLTAERDLKVAIATEALTAGKFALVLEFEGPFDGVTPVTYRKQ